MKAGPSYLLGTGKPYPKTWNRPYIIYTPVGDARGPVFGFLDGFFPHDCGGSCPAADVLQRPFYLQMLRDFELAWLIPYLERMAAGESFTVDQLQSIYHQHTGRQMEASSDAGQFKFMARPGDEFG
jgi:hypothetical protein